MTSDSVRNDAGTRQDARKERLSIDNLTVKVGIRILSLDQDSSLQTNTSKQSFALRIRKHRSGIDERSVDGSSYADRTRGGGEGSSERDVTAL